MSNTRNGVLLGMFGLLALAVSAGASGCESEPSPITLHGEDELFPGFSYSTGLQPPGSPVQASFEVSATGSTVVEMKAQPSGSSDSPELTGIPDSGSVKVTGGFAMIGTLKIDIDGLPSYDGPIPGIENVNIAVDGTASFDPFSVGKEVKVSAAIPPTQLPKIPLPGGIPGSLVLEVGEGSFVEIGVTGTCAGIASDSASYAADLTRGGTLVIKPSVEVEVPIVGTKTFDIPSFTVDLALDGTSMSASTSVTEYGGSVDGDKADGKTCSGDGGGGGDAGGGSEGGAGAGGNTGNEGGSTSDTGGGGGSGSDFVCLLGETCTAPNADTCTCSGCDFATCVDDAQGIADCVCPVCGQDPFCSDTANCVDGDGCDPFVEGCQCADCFDHPQCAP
ncbi:MAG: hypothetical protein HOW73_12245 [Polyangiaceae bacterium]|nr:hypothetical protein [Polyangiaceae bacterium]